MGGKNTNWKLETANHYTERKWIDRGARIGLQETIELELTENPHRTIVDPGSGCEFGAIEELFRTLFFDIGPQCLSDIILQVLRLRICAHQQTRLHADGELPATVRVFGVGGKTQFDRCLEKGGYELIFLKMVAAFLVRKGQGLIVIGRHQHLLLIEKDIAASNAHTCAHA